MKIALEHVNPVFNKETNCVSGIIRMYGNSCIAEHGLRTCCSNDEALIY